MTSKKMIGIWDLLIIRNLSRDREKSIWFFERLNWFSRNQFIFDKSNTFSKNIQQLTCCFYEQFILLYSYRGDFNWFRGMESIFVYTTIFSLIV
jgi:hypothetical protein